jgi:hypothetical protein
MARQNSFDASSIQTKAQLRFMGCAFLLCVVNIRLNGDRFSFWAQDAMGQWRCRLVI